MFFIEWSVATVFLTADPWYWNQFALVRLEPVGLPVYQVELDYSQMPLVMG